ncbi:hypothetical protein [Streptomyces olivochromogenes]|uniref:hypothetical protein n=1 Tax=Streptomyces olivochromogenes TaxID=1963 RepID=UPI001F2A1ACC|nr:hypothetical protein [Streptomyces olivochromogenes]MCF3136095.1 hypothetical protein [Streptomyces olivochromogenes]
MNMNDLRRTLRRSTCGREPSGTPDEVPVVAFPMPVPAMSPATASSGPKAAALRARLAQTLTAADPWSGRSALPTHLLTAAGLAARLREELGVSVSGASVEASAEPADTPGLSDFRTRTLPLTACQTLAEGLGVLGRAVMDLAHTPLGAHDAAAELAALRQAMEYWADVAGVGSAETEIRPSRTASLPPTEAEGEPPLGAGAERWFIGHHCRFFLEATAAALLTRAVTHVRRRQPERAADALTQATVCVQGMPAAVAHACALPAAQHGDETTPPEPDSPAQPRPLSGRTHLTYRHYRQALARVLTELPTPAAELRDRHPALAHARTGLLHADLIDGERHVHIAYTLLGTARSSAQHPGAPTNAVTELRRISHYRARQYAPLLRPADRS